MTAERFIVGRVTGDYSTGEIRDQEGTVLVEVPTWSKVREKESLIPAITTQDNIVRFITDAINEKLER